MFRAVFPPIIRSGSSKQAWRIPDVMCTDLELLMMGGKTARNMYRIDNNKGYCITLHLVGYMYLKKIGLQFVQLVGKSQVSKSNL